MSRLAQVITTTMAVLSTILYGALVIALLAAVAILVYRMRWFVGGIAAAACVFYTVRYLYRRYF